MVRRLIDYLPHILRNVREYRALLIDGEQDEVSSLWDWIDSVFNDQFMETATVNGVKRWEKMLGITPQSTLTLDERKYNILMKFIEQLPYSYRALERLLTMLCGADGFIINLNASGYTVEIKIAVGNHQNYNQVVDLMNRITPANLVITVSRLYNTWSDASILTWDEAAAYTWDTIRTEALS